MLQNNDPQIVQKNKKKIQHKILFELFPLLLTWDSLALHGHCKIMYNYTSSALRFA